MAIHVDHEMLMPCRTMGCPTVLVSVYNQTLYVQRERLEILMIRLNVRMSSAESHCVSSHSPDE